jgi:hypothetical protein
MWLRLVSTLAGNEWNLLKTYEILLRPTAMSWVHPPRITLTCQSWSCLSPSLKFSSIDRRQRVGLKATPPPLLRTLYGALNAYYVYGEIDALCRRAHKIGFLLCFLLPQKIRIDFGTANKPRNLVYSTPSNSHFSFCWGCHKPRKYPASPNSIKVGCCAALWWWHAHCIEWIV